MFSFTDLLFLLSTFSFVVIGKIGKGFYFWIWEIAASFLSFFFFLFAM